jgi:hypothetical protein
MDVQWFDRISTAFATGRARRALLNGMAGATLAAVMTPAIAGADRKSRKKRKKKAQQKCETQVDQKCQAQVGQCLAFLTQQCAPAQDPDACVAEARPCCDFFATCDARSALSCLGGIQVESQQN